MAEKTEVEDFQAFGKLVRQRRQTLGLSQEALASSVDSLVSVDTQGQNVDPVVSDSSVSLTPPEGLVQCTTFKMIRYNNRAPI